VQQIACSACGAKSIHIEREQQLLQVVALMLLMKPGHLNGREMRYLRGACDLSQAKLALSLGVRRETVAERESQETPGLDAGAEFFLRVILLRQFLEYLKSDDHLGAEHHKILRDHCNAVFGMSDRVLKHPRKRALAVRQVGKSWEPALAIA
jgi:DNA-binding transcriptional regulator YiaG